MKKIIMFVAIALAVASFGFIVLNAEEIPTTTAVETTAITSRFGFGRMGGMMGGYYNTTSGTNTNPYYGGMMGGYYNTNTNGTYYGCHGAGIVDITSYEFLYAHLSEEDQATVDAKYLELLLTIDFETLSAEDQLLALTTLKADLVEFIETEGFVVSYYRP